MFAAAFDHLQGWGVVAAAPIPQGTFVAEYLGEALSNAEAAARLAAYDAASAAAAAAGRPNPGHALLVGAGHMCMII